MPANKTPLGALPSRFRRHRLLIVGCGDVGLRVAGLLAPRVRVLALSSTPERGPSLRARGIVVMNGNLDQQNTLARLAGVANSVLHLAPPPGAGSSDPRTAHLLQALSRRTPPKRLIYGSTSGIYGDCAGAWVSETRPPKPQSPRGRRRLDAEQKIRRAGKGGVIRTNVLRIPGIYALDRPNGTPRDRLERRTPVLQAQDDVFTSHIHADDLARACIAALWRGRAQRAYNVADQTELKMGDYMDLAADLWSLARPPRLSRETIAAQLSAERFSFMEESRRLLNQRLREELRLKLHYPTVVEGLSKRPI